MATGVMSGMSSKTKEYLPICPALSLTENKPTVTKLSNNQFVLVSLFYPEDLYHSKMFQCLNYRFFLLRSTLRLSGILRLGLVIALANFKSAFSLNLRNV